MKRYHLIATLLLSLSVTSLSAEEQIFQENFEGFDDAPKGVIQREGYAFSAEPVENAKIEIVTPSAAFRGEPPSQRALWLLDQGNREDGPRVRCTFIPEGEFNFAFRFATTTAERNGVLLLRLLNAKGETVASFQLLSTTHEEGQIGLNPLSKLASLRQIVPERDLFSNHQWTPVEIHYQAEKSRWSLSVNNFRQDEISLEPGLSDHSIAAIEIYTGFGASRSTSLYLNDFSLQRP